MVTLDDRLETLEFLTHLETLYPSLLTADPIMNWADWTRNPVQTFAVLQQACQANATVGELIGQFGGDDMRYLYVIMQVLRTLADASAYPIEHIDHDVSLQRGECHVAFGDMIIHGSMKHHQGHLMALGNVTIEGVCADDAFAYSCLIVGGSLKTRGLVTFGEVAICGDVEASEIVYGCANEYSLYVGGTLHTKYVVTQYHHMQCGALAIQGMVEEYQQMDQLRDILIPSLVQPSPYASSGYEFYPGDMIELLAAGQPIYR